VLTFAIVIPNFNQSRFLPTAFESLKHQSVPFNLAVMDGGSSDGFNKVVEGYSDIITFLISAPDEGQAAAIREGKDRIAGDVVAWLNADDYYFPGALDKVAECFEKDPELDVVYGNAIHATPEGFFLSYFPPIQEFSARDLTRSCFICQPACFVRRRTYDMVGGIDPSLHYTMDWDLWCRLSRSGAKFHYLGEPLAAVRYYTDTKTLSGDRDRYLEIWRIERKYGRRLLPFSWLGFYFFDLSFKAKKTVAEKIAFDGLGFLRRLKKRLRYSTNEVNRTIYGLRRWEPLVEGRCVIHLPWYDKRPWKRLRLRVQPADELYQITVNGVYAQALLAQKDSLLMDVPPLEEPYRRISIECLARHRWSLFRFSFELT
jgi:glycosyltransferase involved in cell wall biosynthesis